MSKPKLKLGFQCQEKHQETYRYNKELGPAVVKSINILDPEHYTRLAADNPGVDLVYRQVPNGPWHDDPEGDGRRWAEHLYGLVGHISEITLVEGHNEYVHAPPHNSPDDLDRADRFMVAFIDGVHDLWDGRVHAVVLNASCGHFNEDITDFFPRTLTKLQQCGKCLLGLHEYDHPDADMLGDGEHNLCGKFLRNLAGLKAAGYDRVRIAITECGVDSGVGAPPGSGHVGFKYWGPMAWARYLNARNLGWYLPLAQETEGVAWLTLFGCGMHGEWASFDVADTYVIDGIGTIYSIWVPPEEPPEPPEEIKMDIYDFDGNKKDWNWLTQNFGDIRIRPIEEMWQPQQGDRVYKVKYFRAKRGYSSCLINVRDRGGKPVVGETVIWGYSSAAHHGYSNKGWNWTEIGDAGDTNSTGDVGPGMSVDGYYMPPDGGPYWCWVWDFPSEKVEGLGMIAGTFHDHLDVGYQEELYDDGELPPGPPPDPETPSDLLKVAQEQLEVSKRILGHVAVIREKIEQEPPEPPPEPPEPEEFLVEFFNNVNLSGEPVYTMKEKPPFWHNWGLGSPVPGIVNEDYISAQWVGYFTFEAKTYRFNIKTDDGARLWIDGEKVLDKWFPQGPTLYTVDIPLAAGKHSIRLEWYEQAGGAVLDFNWE